ncbi:MAG: hypothetical protein AB7N76_25760 [Planctomycetota bacterium]
MDAPLDPATPQPDSQAGARGPGRAGGERRRAALALGLNLALFLTTYALFTVRFHCNDDPRMMLVTAGLVKSTAPSPFTPFLHVSLGWLLQRLYGLSLAVPWYPLLLIASLLAAHGALLYLALRRHGRPALAGYLVYFAAVGVRLISELQFTIVAAVLSLAGLLLVLEAGGLGQEAEAEQPPPAARPLLVTGLALLLWGWLFRALAGALVVGLSAPLLLLLGRRCLLAAASPARAAARVAACGLGGGLGLALALLAVNAWAFAADPDARGFWRANGLITAVNDFDVDLRLGPEELARHIAAAGWSENDYKLLKSWLVIDPALYAPERYEAFLAGVPRTNLHLGVVALAARAAEPLAHPLVRRALVLLALALCWLRVGREARWGLLGVLALLVAASAALCLFLKPMPRRVFFGLTPLIALLPALGLPARALPAPGRARRLAGGVLLLLVAAQTALFARDELRRSRLLAAGAPAYRRALLGLAAQPRRVYVSWAFACDLELLPPFTDLRELPPLLIVDAYPYPGTRIALRELGIDDLSLALARRPDVLLVTHQARLPALVLYLRYLREHHGLEVEVRAVQRNDLFAVLALTPKGAAPKGAASGPR